MSFGGIVFSSRTKDETSPPAKRGIKGLVVIATLGWVIASLMVADKLYAQTMNGSLHNALVRSHSTEPINVPLSAT